MRFQVACQPDQGVCCTVCRGGKEQMGGCQNYGPFLGTLNIRCRIITLMFCPELFVLRSVKLVLEEIDSRTPKLPNT